MPYPRGEGDCLSVALPPAVFALRDAAGSNPVSVPHITAAHPAFETNVTTSRPSQQPEQGTASQNLVVAGVTRVRSQLSSGLKTAHPVNNKNG